MESKAEKKVIIKNQELKDILLELKKVDDEIVELVKQSEDAKVVFDSKIMVRQKLVDSMKPIVNAEFTGQLGEFEVLANVTLPEDHSDDSVEVRIVDEVEMFKDKKRKSKEVNYNGPEGDVIEEKVA